MRLHIHHQTAYRYSAPARRMVQALRLWPAPNAGQQVLAWEVRAGDVAIPPRQTDAFGNAITVHALDGPLDSVIISVTGVVDTEDAQGRVRGTEERLPSVFYLGETPATTADEAILGLAAETHARDAETRIERLMEQVRARIDFIEGVTHARTTAAEALALGAGVCQDHSQTMIAAARVMGFPARYVSGYLWTSELEASASHAWCEVLIPELGWVGFDPANRCRPGHAYVRVATGRDAHEAAPIRGYREGGAEEQLDVRVRVGIEDVSQQ